MSRVLGTDFCYTDKKQTLVGSVGKHGDFPYLKSGNDKLFKGNRFGRQFVTGDLDNKVLGEDRRFIEMQGRVLASHLSKGGTTVKFVSGKGNAMIGNKKTKAQLISKVENRPVLVPIK